MRNTILLACVLTGLTGGRALAGSFNFGEYALQPRPDILSNSLDLTYAPSTDPMDPGTLSITGPAITYAPTDVVADSKPILNGASFGSFSLTAMIGQTPDLLGESVTGTVQILGTVAGSYTSGILLTGELFAFKSKTEITGSGLNSTMDFLFHVIGGDAADVYGEVGWVQVSRIITNAAGGYEGDFTVPFNNEQVQTDTNPAFAVVPEPGSFFLAAFGLVGLVAGNRVRRKRQQQAS